MTTANIFPDYTITELPETGSTNIYVENLLKTSDVAEGSVIFTLNQTAGIGQQENKWESEAGKNLTLTTVLYPKFLHASEQFFLTIITSLATCSVLDFFLKNKDSRIKWPNDIFYHHRKVAGILIKNSVLGTSIDQTIVGVGLNVNQTHFHSAPNASSLKIISNVTYDIEDVLSKWHTFFANYYSLLKNDSSGLLNLYYSRMYLKDVFAMYEIANQKVEACITGVDEYGQLLLEGRNGKNYVCGLKEIVFPTY